MDLIKSIFYGLIVLFSLQEFEMLGMFGFGSQLVAPRMFLGDSNATMLDRPAKPQGEFQKHSSAQQKAEKKDWLQDGMKGGNCIMHVYEDKHKMDVDMVENLQKYAKIILLPIHTNARLIGNNEHRKQSGGYSDLAKYALLMSIKK